jgi:PadR family transcriptional regulator, regulatory protein PadR
MQRQKAWGRKRGEDLDRKMLYGHFELLVLAALSGGDLHGYALRTALAERSGGRLQVAFGRLYPLLHGLERRGLLCSRVEPAGAVRRRRVYALTVSGQARLTFLRTKWQSFAGGVERLLS